MTREDYIQEVVRLVYGPADPPRLRIALHALLDPAQTDDTLRAYQRDRDAALHRAEVAEKLCVELKTSRDAVVLDLNEMIDAAKHAIPEAEHPLEKMPHNWAWQIRALGDDRRAAYKQRDEARAERVACNGTIVHDPITRCPVHDK